MAGESVLTIVGNTTSNAELRVTPQGKSVCNFTVAATPRQFDRASGKWKDGDALFMRCNLWGEAAERVVEGIPKGTRVIVQGRLKQRSYETREGEKRTVVELEVDEIGPSVRYVGVAIRKAERATSSRTVDDPWDSAPKSSDGFTPADDNRIPF